MVTIDADCTSSDESDNDSNDGSREKRPDYVPMGPGSQPNVSFG